MPEDEEQTETYRNPHVGFVAYVPPGAWRRESIRRLREAAGCGERSHSGKSTPCITCHREDLMGGGDNPPIVGRSPSYIVRQMWDIQQGTRHGEPAELMKITIAKLTPDDLIAIAAYVASLPPPRTAL